MNELFQPKIEETFYYAQRPDGSLIKVSTSSGKILAESPRESDIHNADLPTPAQFLSTRGQKSWHYNDVYKDIISQKVAEGVSLTDICKTQGFPGASIVARWRAENPDFEEAIVAARRMRAEALVDTIASNLESTKEIAKDDLPAERLYYDKAKWLAEKYDPKTYGNRVTHTGDKDNPIAIMVDTGIRREALPVDTTDDTIETEYTKKDD